MQLTSKRTMKIVPTRPRFPGLFKLPSESDYSVILKKLDLVISNAKYGQSLLILSTSSPLNIFLEKGQSQLIHIHPAGNPAPLHIIYRRNYGKIKTYVSTKISEPNQELNDFSTHGDVIEITAYDSTFHIQRVAIFLYCLSECNVAISLKYGAEALRKNEVLKSLQSVVRNRETWQEDSLDLMIKQEKINQKKNAGKRVKSYVNFKEFFERNTIRKETLRTRREENYQRSKVLKKNHSMKLRSLSEKIEKKEKSGKAKEIVGYKKDMANVLIRLLGVCTVSIAWHHKMIEFKVRKARHQVIIRKINTFKSIYKSWSIKRNKLTALESCRLSLILFKNSCKPISSKDFSQKIKKVLFNIKASIISKYKFDHFYKAGTFYLVFLIQHEWRRYKLSKGFRLAQLDKIWRYLYNNLPKKRQKQLNFPRATLKSLLESYYSHYLHTFYSKPPARFSFENLLNPDLLIPFLSSKKNNKPI